MAIRLISEVRVTTQQTLTQARLALGLSMEVLAAKAGVSWRTIQRIESADAVPISEVRVRIAAALGVAVSEIAWPEIKLEQ